MTRHPWWVLYRKAHLCCVCVGANAQRFWVQCKGVGGGTGPPRTRDDLALLSAPCAMPSTLCCFVPLHVMLCRAVLCMQGAASSAPQQLQQRSLTPQPHTDTAARHPTSARPSRSPHSSSSSSAKDSSTAVPSSSSRSAAAAAARGGSDGCGSSTEGCGSSRCVSYGFCITIVAVKHAEYAIGQAAYGRSAGVPSSCSLPTYVPTDPG